MFALNKSVSKLRSLSKSKSSEKSDSKDVNKIKRKKSKNVQKSDDQIKRKRLEKGVVKISKIPHGFYEQQMFQYFSQFGKVLRLRISKNPKTGNYRNYGFIEFECEEVAKIAANTMNNYLMFDHIIQCEFIPKSKLEEKPNLFNQWNRQFFSSTELHKSLHNRSKSVDKEFKLLRHRLKKVRQMENFLKEKGLDFKCEVINLPDISKLREMDKKSQTETNVGLKTPKRQLKRERPLKTPKRELIETVPLSIKSSLTKSERRRSLKSPISSLYPRLLKFSIILSTKKRKII